MLPFPRHSKIDKTINTILPLRSFDCRRKPDIEVRLTNRLSFLKNLPPIVDALKDTSINDGDNRMFPVEGKIIVKETYLFPDYIEDLNSNRVIESKVKTQQKIVYGSRPEPNQRSKSNIIEKNRLSNMESPGQAPKSVVSTITHTRNSFIGPGIEANESIFTTALQQRTNEAWKFMETRRNGDNENSSTSLGSLPTIDYHTKKKTSLTPLLNSHMEGEEDFFEGTIIRGMKSGFCRILYSSFIYKEGFYVNGMLEGEGSIKYPNGVTLFGSFKNNMLQSHIILSVDNLNYPVDYVEGDYHNNQIFVNEKNVLFVTVKVCENISEYTGKIKIYFRNGFKLDSMYEKGMLSENFDSVLYDKFSTPVEGRIRHGINVETNGIYAFRPTADPENEYVLLFKGEGTVVRKHKR